MGPVGSSGLVLFRGISYRLSVDNFSKESGLAVLTGQLADSPHLLSFVEANFGAVEQKGMRQNLLESADASEFSLRQWVESLHTLRSWLDAQGLAMSAEDELGYVHCAAEVAGPGSNLTYLPALVSDMLQSYGCERAEPHRAGETDSDE